MTGGEAPLLTSARSCLPSRLAQPPPPFSRGRGLALSPLYPGALPLWRPGLRLPGHLKETLPCWLHQAGLQEVCLQGPRAQEQKRWPPGELGDGQVSVGTQTLLCSVPVTFLYRPFVAEAKTCDSIPWAQGV